MVRYKVLASLIISALVLLVIPNKANALFSSDLQYSSSYPGGFIIDGSCGNSITTSSLSIGSITLTNGVCGSAIVLQPNEVVHAKVLVKPVLGSVSLGPTWSYPTSGGGFLTTLDTEFSQIGGTSYTSFSNAGGFLQYNGLDNRNSSFMFDFYAVNNSGQTTTGVRIGANSPALFTINTLNSATSTSLMITNIDIYNIATPVDTEAQNDYYEQQNQGNTNIEGQDTSGTDQGVSDSDYSSLLDIFTGFISAITNVSGGTCTISLNTDFANLGNVDLCTYDPPSYIQIIGSIILILLFVPLSMALIKRILKTIQELQT